MRDRIIRASIESLRREGLRFSVDTLAEKLKMSKKTIYKYFPDKEALALALYETYYADAKKQAAQAAARGGESAVAELLSVYFDAKEMTQNDVFNKFKLNGSVLSYTSVQNDALWETIAASFAGDVSAEDANTLRVIVDGAFEKLCRERMDPDAVIERLAKWIL